jgi:hypothetical protein
MPTMSQPYQKLPKIEILDPGIVLSFNCQAVVLPLLRFLAGGVVGWFGGMGVDISFNLYISLCGG